MNQDPSIIKELNGTASLTRDNFHNADNPMLHSTEDADGITITDKTNSTSPQLVEQIDGVVLHQQDAPFVPADIKTNKHVDDDFSAWKT